MSAPSRVSAATRPDPEAGQATYDLDRAHVFHSWSAQDKISPLPVAGGENATFWDFEGNEYLDFNSQMVNLNLGHQHPKLVQAIQEQAGKLATIAPSFANDTRSEAARLIAGVAPEGMNHVFFTNGGAEAVENAVRMARIHAGRDKVMAAYRSYHGATATAITLTGEPRRFNNRHTDGGVVHFQGPYTYQSPFWSENEEQESERALEHLERQIVLEGAHTIAAIIMEPVVGGMGVIVPPVGYLKGLKEICDKYGILFIADEVMVGFGRCGTWFTFENFDVTPDLITFAKGSNSGYVPLGGVVISDKIHDTFAEKPFPGGLTYSGHPLACAPVVATFEVFEEENILERVRDLGERVVRPRLEELREKHAIVGDVRGLGLFWAIELVKDKETREPLVPYNPSGDQMTPMNEFAAACKKAGLWPYIGMNRTHIAPPLTISEEDLLRGLDIIDEALGGIGGYAG
ncbi:aspartate aminotransferase family protein [Corynebacterium halotolerans]|uniref:4-aminobutyrate aminotransferase n=1 Tax=Corynebacterium halotolerans YIM 70093 = DSM 44683 TaxID=1121362 RepID=M1P335_9CORY|nr:aspartate aminotransferase family protein [Corynebacterium halotolerans]AGF71091.1 4-aminobutyrate aminotransferase [Corynebacterium halotolerans YIM 70093 = DSM 44683]